jgi:hypothetical protein
MKSFWRDASVSIEESAAGDDIMDMGMVLQGSSPSVKDAEKKPGRSAPM